MRWRRGEPVQVVTDLREPLVAQHRRRIRIRLVALAVWIAGWIVAGVLWRHGWLAVGILLGSGPGIWLLWWLLVPAPDVGRRRAVTPPPRRGLPGPED